ncbi:hypothetical protein HanPSC8_Chr10g0425751 [Helianthus annuus]|nr:hypothetical protein HanPSC8_Chr10g0425741 [Helianthus annuus]KAJ0883784.1 hypothetical protein HanPSC8_Chr10g0425751 [Helianthus annuus]
MVVPDGKNGEREIDRERLRRMRAAAAACDGDCGDSMFSDDFPMTGDGSDSSGMATNRSNSGGSVQIVAAIEVGLRHW